MTSPEDMLKFLKQRLIDVTRPDEIATMMASLASNSAWAYLGGSGARQQIFQLDGDLRVVFQFDVTDKLVAYGAYVNTEPWEQALNGGQMSPVSETEVSLILIHHGE